MAVTLVNGHRRERSQIRGYATVPELYRIIDAEQRATAPAGRAGTSVTSASPTESSFPAARSSDPSRTCTVGQRRCAATCRN